MTFTPELLSPAGNLSAGLAAFDAGADAVYAGLDKFNARERGENFTHDTLLALIEYAHERHKKVYLTLNTLVKENELDEVAELLSKLYAALPDAVLIQDLGVAKMVKECFPEITMHASTQMGIHNLQGLKIAAELGFKRAVLERQLTLEEITLLAKESPIELEVFVHGALCCSISGECLFSSWSGGYSGNRGKCKQPCRRRFFSKQGNGFFFSTADLCTLEMIPELKKLGISSFKIEGRLRQADYVFNAVSAYRKVMDAEIVDKKVLGEARNLLAESCGRKWSQGFYSTESMKTLIQYNALGASGAPCGQVSDIQENGFAFTATRRVHLGDRIRIQPITGDEGPSLTITKLFVNRAPATVASAGDHCFVCCDKPVEFKAIVYKIGHAGNEPKERSLPKLRKKLNAIFNFSADTFTGTIINTVPPIVFSTPIEVQPAEKRAISDSQINEQFSFRSNPEYASGSITSTFEDSYFMPLSELKKLKNTFWSHVMEELGNVTLPPAGELNMTKYRALRFAQEVIDPVGFRRETVAVSPASATFGNPKARVASSIFSYTKKAEEIILPDFCAPGKIDQLKRLIAEAVQTGVRRFRACSLFNFDLLKEYENLEIVTGYGIPVCNSFAVETLGKIGACQIMAHVELERAAVERLIKRSVLPVELYRFGRIPLLSTRAEIAAEDEIKDARAAKFTIIQDRPVGLTRLYSSKVLSIPKVAGASDFYDLTHAHWGAKELFEFNFNTELL